MAPRSARITLSFGRDSDGPRSVGYFNMLGLSFTLYQIWLYMAVFSATKTFASEGTLAPLSIPNHGALVYTFLIVSGALLILFAALSRSMTRFFESRRSVIVAGACGTVGTLLLQLGIGSEAIGVIGSGACMGVCASIFIVLLGNAFTKFEFVTCVLNSAVSVALGFICSVALVNWVPAPVSGLMATLMPILMTIVFWKETPSLPESTDSAITTSHMHAYLGRFAASMVLLGVAVGALRVVCADRLLSSGAITIELVMGVACIGGVILFVFAIVMAKRETEWDSLFCIIIPVVVLGVASMAGLLTDAELIASFFVTLGFVSIVSLVWIFLASLSRNLNGSSVVIFGMGYGIMQAASALGCLLSNWLLSMDAVSAMELFSVGEGLPAAMIAETALPSLLCIAALSLFLCVALSFAYAVFPRYRELKAILSSILSELAMSRARMAADEAAADAASQGPAGDDGALSDAESRMAIDSSSEGVSGSSEEPSMDNAEDEQPQREEKGSFVRRCEQLSESFGLSARESEVFFLLAKGHNAAFITDKLCVSRSTVKTHINHIYKKMDIHTQQELLTMVEDRARGPLGVEIDRNAIREALERDPSQVVEQIHRDYIGF